jgi:phosphate transport system protein
MTKHLRNEIERLKKKILALSAHVEGCVYHAVKSFTDRDAAMARKCIESDEEVDQMEVEVEEDCLKILALHQPVANDLRFIVAVLKINNDLERIGDLASNISDNTIYLTGKERVDVPFDLLKMAEKVKTMLKQSIDSLVNLDAPLAKQVCDMDDDIDSLHREMYRVIEKRITEQPDRIDCLIRFLSASRQLERIADHATNIAEDVIYMIEGEIYRHRIEEYNVG